MNMITGIKDQINGIYATLKNSPPDKIELYASVPSEHIKRFEEKFNIELPLDYKYLLSLSNGFYYDGFGNFVCFDTRKFDDNGTCPIVFWDHDIEYNETNGPEIINNSFVEFLIETIFDEEL